MAGRAKSIKDLTEIEDKIRSLELGRIIPRSSVDYSSITCERCGGLVDYPSGPDNYNYKMCYCDIDFSTFDLNNDSNKEPIL